MCETASAERPEVRADLGAPECKEIADRITGTGARESGAQGFGQLALQPAADHRLVTDLMQDRRQIVLFLKARVRDLYKGHRVTSAARELNILAKRLRTETSIAPDDRRFDHRERGVRLADRIESECIAS